MALAAALHCALDTTRSIVVLLVLATTSPELSQSPCRRQNVASIASTDVWRTDGTAALAFESGLTIDADGPPNAYHPENKGLDYLANAGGPGKWRAVVTDTGTPTGQPLVQGPADPFPGYYISTTSLADSSKPRADPARYVDSTKIPYVALPPGLLAPNLSGGAQLGDFAAVVNRKNRKVVYALVADVGPRKQARRFHRPRRRAGHFVKSPERRCQAQHCCCSLSRLGRW